MADYLCPSDISISINEKKWMFNCRVDDIDVKGNRRWKYENISCISCKKDIDETQVHLLECEYLVGKSELITYIPQYCELYNGSLEEQLYVSRLLKDNFRRRNTLRGTM